MRQNPIQRYGLWVNDLSERKPLLGWPLLIINVLCFFVVFGAAIILAVTVFVGGPLWVLETLFGKGIYSFIGWGLAVMLVIALWETAKPKH